VRECCPRWRAPWRFRGEGWQFRFTSRILPQRPIKNKRLRWRSGLALSARCHVGKRCLRQPRAADLLSYGTQAPSRVCEPQSWSRKCDSEGGALGSTRPKEQSTSSTGSRFTRAPGREKVVTRLQDKGMATSLLWKECWRERTSAAAYGYEVEPV
jgi:hypothetical protein